MSHHVDRGYRSLTYHPFDSHHFLVFTTFHNLHRIQFFRNLKCSPFLSTQIKSFDNIAAGDD